VVAAAVGGAKCLLVKKLLSAIYLPKEAPKPPGGKR